MDDFDIYELLKEASIKDDVVGVAKRVAEWAKTHPHEIAGGAIGGGLAGLGTYLASRPGKDGRSIDQGKPSKHKEPEDNEGFTGGIGRIFSNTKREVADLAAKHPASMALASLPAGISAGRFFANKLKTGAAKEDTRSPKHADKWGNRGAAIAAAPSIGLTALALLHPKGRAVLRRRGVSKGEVASHGAVKALGHGVGGYLAGRAAHRFTYGPTKGKKMEKKSTAELIKMADAWGRELARKTKTARVGNAVASAATLAAMGMLGHHKGKKQKERGEEHTFGLPQLAASTLLAPAGTAYQVGRYMAHNNPRIKKGKKEKKAAGLVGSPAGALGHAIGKLGKHIMKTPAAKRMAIGAAVGAGGDLLFNKDRSVGSMVGKAGLGAAAGAAAKPGMKALARGTKGTSVGEGISEGLKGWQKKD